MHAIIGSVLKLDKVEASFYPLCSCKNTSYTTLLLINIFLNVLLLCIFTLFFFHWDEGIQRTDIIYLHIPKTNILPVT